jgi:hypothetical protein
MPTTETHNRINPAAPAGSPDSLGAESTRDGRPATDDRVVEAIDEEGPQIPRPDPQSTDPSAHQ